MNKFDHLARCSNIFTIQELNLIPTRDPFFN